MIAVPLAPFGGCKHGVEDSPLGDKVLRAVEYCGQCKEERRHRAREAAKTRKARGTCWSRSFVPHHRQTHRSVPAWLASSVEVFGDWVILNDRLVYSPTRSPVWIVDVNTYRVEELLTVEHLKLLLSGRTGLGIGDEPLFTGASELTIAPWSAIDGGEDLERYGLGGKR